MPEKESIEEENPNKQGMGESLGTVCVRGMVLGAGLDDVKPWVQKGERASRGKSGYCLQAFRGAKKDLIKEKALGLVTRHHPGALRSLLELSGNDRDKANAEKSL